MLPPSPIERVKPLLGTYVHIRVEGLALDLANRAITQAFAEIAAVHNLMSFHDSQSDISRINRQGAHDAVTVDERTFAVLQTALDIAARSGGAFDPCIGHTLVSRAVLPAPFAIEDMVGDWRSIELMPGNRVHLHCPAWIDLGGIAKGYAVDRAIDVLASFGPEQVCVNAGGDLRVLGPHPERTMLDVENHDDQLPMVELRQESMASSCGIMLGRERHDVKTPHVATGAAHEVPLAFVSVIAPSCMHADALTKVVMGMGEEAQPCLQAFKAHALLLRDGCWHEIAGES